MGAEIGALAPLQGILNAGRGIRAGPAGGFPNRKNENRAMKARSEVKLRTIFFSGPAIAHRAKNF